MSRIPLVEPEHASAEVRALSHNPRLSSRYRELASLRASQLNSCHSGQRIHGF